jgi:hypothetical protein
VRARPLPGPSGFDEFLWRASIGDQPEQVSLHQKEQAYIGLAQPYPVGQDGLEHGRHARRRAVDHA